MALVPGQQKMVHQGSRRHNRHRQAVNLPDIGLCAAKKAMQWSFFHPYLVERCGISLLCH